MKPMAPGLFLIILHLFYLHGISFTILQSLLSNLDNKNTKMYLDLKDNFWWTGMKKDIVEYVAVCDVCQRVKAEHQKPAGLLQPLPIPNGSGIN